MVSQRRRGVFSSFMWAWLMVSACSAGPEDVGSDAADATPEVAWHDSTLDDSWPVMMFDQQNLDPFLANEGWTKLVGDHRLDRAVAKLGALGGLAGARAHAESSTLYKQGALLAAYSFIETYGVTPQPTDPVGVAHLLTVSYSVVGEISLAREQSTALIAATSDDHPARAWHGPWAAWLSSEGTPTWPPDLSSLPMALPEVTAGEWPEAPPVPHYNLTERDESKRQRSMGDPGALVALALWHEAAAKASAGGEHEAVVDVAGARYAMPGEPALVVRVSLPPEFLFGSDFLSPTDPSFLLDVMASGDLGAVENHPDSLLAAATVRSTKDGALYAESAIDASAELRAAVLDAAREKFGKVEAFDRQLADTASVGLLRNLSLLAEATGDREVSGILRINAMERSDGHTADPVGLMALAAWDASNRYPMRATDILHHQARRYTALEVARSGLDVLAIRVSRETTDQNPGM